MREHRDGVLGVEPEPVAVRDDAVGGPAGQGLQLGQSGGQQSGVAAELVDQEPADEPLIVGFEHRDRAVQVREQPAAVDVADDHDRQVGGAGQTHVGDVGRPQVDLGRRARAFHDDGVEFCSELMQFVGYHRCQTFPVGEVVPGADGVDDPAVDHQLRGAVTSGLEQDGVETDAGRQARGPGLHRLGAADLTALDRDRRVVGHVLRLERRDPNALAGKQPAQPGDDHGLTGIGSGAGDQQRAAHVDADRALTAKQTGPGISQWRTFAMTRHSWVRISAPPSVTTSVCSNWAVHFLSLVATVQSSSQIS